MSLKADDMMFQILDENDPAVFSLIKRNLWGRVIENPTPSHGEHTFVAKVINVAEKGEEIAPKQMLARVASAGYHVMGIRGLMAIQKRPGGIHRFFQDQDVSLFGGTIFEYNPHEAADAMVQSMCTTSGISMKDLLMQANIGEAPKCGTPFENLRLEAEKIKKKKEENPVITRIAFLSCDGSIMAGDGKRRSGGSWSIHAQTFDPRGLASLCDHTCKVLVYDTIYPLKSSPKSTLVPMALPTTLIQ